MKRKIFLFFISLSFSQSNYAAALEENLLPKGAIRFFNVGQGNCTLITTEGRPPILMDAGTTHYKHLGKDRMGIVRPIVEAIQASYRSLDPSLYENRWPLTISISHFDEDHHNLVPDILRTLLSVDTTDTPLAARLVIGGDEDNIFGFEDDRIVEEWQKSDHPLNTSAVKQWLAFGEVTSEGDRSPVSVISHLLGEKDIDLLVPSRDANSRSLVLRTAVQNWSAVIPGDATTKTTNQVIAHMERYGDIQADILLASHHGAIESCNDKDWIRRVAPRFVIVSAGTRRDYEHPRGDVVERFLNVGEENGRFKVVPPHDIYYYKEKQLAGHRSLPTIPGDGYLTIRGVTDPIYTTFTNGRIDFSSDASDLPSCEIEPYGARGASGGAGAKVVGDLEIELARYKMSGGVISEEGAGGEDGMPAHGGTAGSRNRDADELPAAQAAPATPVRSTIGDASTTVARGGAGEGPTPPSVALSPSLLERLGGLTLAGRDLVWDMTKAVSPKVAKVLWDGGAAVGTTVATYTPVVAGAIFNGGKAVSNILVTHGPGVVSVMLEKGKSFGGVVATYTPVVTESVASGGAAVSNGLKAALAVCSRPRSTQATAGSQTPQPSSAGAAGMHQLVGSGPGPLRFRGDSRDESDELAARIALMRLFNAAAPAPAASTLPISAATAHAPAPAALASFATPPPSREGMQFVNGYTRSDGRKVEGYWRRTPNR